ncbi:MAG: hypothetical protein GY729_10230 [Desulfobacteraceae bacterium]|nr:hypothetical protein [Desulfobacteraceae bacterium]
MLMVSIKESLLRFLRKFEKAIYSLFRSFQLMGLAVLLLLFIALPNPLTAEAFVGPLQGEYLFKAGDNLAWADPNLDDSDWSKINIPGSWQEQGFKSNKYMGWYRINFTVQADFEDNGLGLFLGQVHNADQTFLNGTKIGSTGKFGRWFVETRGERLYKVPQGLIKPGRMNCLAIRVMSLEMGSGLVTDRPLLDKYLVLLKEKHRREKMVIIEETIFLTLILSLFISCCFFYITGSREKEYIYFALFALLFILSIILDSQMFFETGLKTPVVEAVLLMFMPLIPVTMLMFFVSFANYSITPVIKHTVFFSLGFALATLFFANFNYAAFSLISHLWLVQIVWTSILGLYVIQYAIRRKVPEFFPVILGSASVILSGLFYALFSLGIPALNKYYATLLRFDDHMGLLFMICLVYALGMRFNRIQHKAASLSGKILVAHENERKRLARELHDGLGQNMLAVKFNLQRTNQKMQNNDIEDIIQEVSGSIEELRNISMGLRPALLDKAGLDSAIKSYADRIGNGTDTIVKVVSKTIPRLSSSVEDNIFRIFQEAVGNALKYAKAAHINITLHYNGSMLEMTIADDGVGFDYPKISKTGKGMGLSTIKERMDLLDGKLQIRNLKGKGTKMRIWVRANTI